MARFVARRLLLLVPILLGLSLLIFLWIRALPGSPAQSLLGERATAESIAEVERTLGLDDPLYVQYFTYVKNVAQLDFGTNVVTRRPVVDEIEERFPATVELALAALVFAIGVGIPLGFVAAMRYGSAVDQASLVASLLGISIPVFVLGLVLKYVFSVKLGWLPTVGRVDVTTNIEHPTNFYVLDALIQGEWAALWDTLKHLVLPAIALGSIPLAIVARITRAAVLDVQNEDYVRTAHAKGLPPSVVKWRHVFRNALLPVSTIIGLQVGLLLSGAVLTETIFAWPGMGTWLVGAIEQRNYAVLQAGILFLAVVFVLVNLVVDLSYALINPRIRLS